MLVPDGYLSVLFGGVVLLAVLASSFSPEVNLRNRTRMVGGLASGIMGTAAWIGGPPLALIYQSRSGPQMRATLAVAFSMGTIISLSVLAIAGRVGRSIYSSLSDSSPRSFWDCGLKVCG